MLLPEPTDDPAPNHAGTDTLFQGLLFRVLATNAMRFGIRHRASIAGDYPGLLSRSYINCCWSNGYFFR